VSAPATTARAVSLWLPVVAWALVLFALSSQSDLPAPPPHVTDKMLHAGAYAILAATVLRALAGARWSGVTPTVAALAVLAATAYGASDEFHQSFVPNRSVEIADLAADLAGATLAAALALAARRWRDSRRRDGTDGPAARI
jgi:VanZ family protein